MFNDTYLLTQAVLEGRKTKTRRIINIEEEELAFFQTFYYNQTLDFLDGKDLIEAYFLNNPKKIPMKKGEIVAVAQSYKDISSCGFPVDSRYDLFRKEDWDEDKSQYGKLKAHKGWNNKMFVKPELMPHQIRINNVRIERLQEISNEDCIKEGVVKCDAEDCNNRCYLMSKCDFCHCGNAKDTPREAFSELIDKVSRKRTWESNPFVFAYSFELVK